MDVAIRTVGSDEATAIAGPLIRLLAELAPRAVHLEPETVAMRMRDDRVRVLIAVSGARVVATASLILLMTVTDGLVGRVEDVVVSTSARGSGLGRKLMLSLHEEAYAAGVAYLELTSRPSREAANGLYRSLGYERRETNVYRLKMTR